MTAEPEPIVFSPDPWWSWKTAALRQTNNDGAFNSDARHYYFFWARNAIYHCLKLLDIEPGAQVLLPAYICRAAVDPFLAYGLDVEFYSVKLNCTADILDIQSRLTARTKAILAVHYFGFPQEIQLIRDICDQHQIALIEDCAHVLSGKIGGQPLGTFGDAAIFSWRKFLPVYDGGELVINRPGETRRMDTAEETPLFTLRVALNVIDRSMRQARRPMFRAAYRGFSALENAGRTCADALFRRPPTLRVETSGTEFDKDSIYLPTSRVSRWIKTHSDIGSIVAKRIHNYKILQRELQSPKITPLVAALPESVCPWVFPLFFNGVPRAHRILRKKGIPAVAWDEVRHPALQPGCFSASDFLYENLVFLPIHQCLNDQDMMKIVSAAKSL